MMTLPIHDNHLHLSPSGRNIDALREFKAAGGTGLTLVTLPYPEVRITCGDDFRKSFQITVDFAEKARELGLKVYTAVGPYPILLISLAEQYGMEKAEQIMTDGMRIAAEFINEGKNFFENTALCSIIKGHIVEIRILKLQYLSVRPLSR